MKHRKRNFSRKEFIRTSSMGVLATGMLAGSSLKMLADSKKLAKSMLGNTGIEITKLGVGAPRIEEASVLRYALDNGINFIDTGRHYARGKNEEMVAKAMDGKRRENVIQSKVGIKSKAIKKKLKSESTDTVIHNIFNKSLEGSLKALQTEYIDVLLFHSGSKNEYLYHDAVLDCFTRAKQEGKILASGFSIHSDLVEHAKLHNKDPFYDVIMFSFNPHGRYKHYNRETTWDQEAFIPELRKAAESGTGIIAMKTCLGGPYRGEGEEEATFPGAVKWVLEQPYIHGSAVAMASFQQLDEHLAVHKV